MRRRFERVERNLEKKEIKQKNFFEELEASISFEEAESFWNALFTEEINRNVGNK